MIKGLGIITSVLLLFACNSKQQSVCVTPDPIPICGNVNSVSEPAIFKAKCTTCHMLYKNSTGPKLHNVYNHLPNEEWFELFVRNEDSLIKVNDKYARKIQKWSPVDGNHNFKEISDKQMSEIKEYLTQK
jgi:hypothetical protein